VTGDRPVAVLPTGREQETARRALRTVMAEFATGITVLTARGEQVTHGMTANAFTSVSLDPPMVLCCVARTARMHDAILDARNFGVSVLSVEQESVARYFATKGRPSGMDQFERVDWFPGRHTGVPLLVGSLAWLECELAEVYEGGDHSIVLGTVLSASRGGGRPLLFLGGGFHHHGEPATRSA
jgi:flavin reductase (DIM6/NTAB) family NADH-FMN oxidoreductase RutF